MTIRQRLAIPAIALSLLQPLPLVAEEQSSSEDKKSLSDATLTWVTQTRNEWGQTIGNTGRRLDGFFADTEVIERTNHSFLKLALRAQYAKYGEIDLEPIAKFRLDLPALEDKLRLTIENEPLEGQTLEETSRENILETSSNEPESTIASLKLQLEEFFEPERWKASTSVGIDFDFPSDYFWRAKGSYYWNITPYWTLRTLQKVYYFHRKGWGESTKFLFERDYDSHVFRITSQAKYIHETHVMQFSQRFSMLKELTPVRAMNLQLGILGTNRPNPRVTDYFVNVVYRRQLSEDWLFYEMTPELLFPREDSFKASPSITAKIEIVFSSK